ncbi:unnamed protein product [Acanthoscelides obtectus]|uniref:Uncharacterized protein n=1 Tax=Acanthoscelides obtectus TaxID=200917 RepID=A0A9P0ME21_ACAOB|nr:unnamed protein product [Acanthoscelides obtectus]CAK1623947.1 hypothetical protein AOBTE_LOCUS2248 [Acanthoscelides obtectus]
MKCIKSPEKRFLKTRTRDAIPKLAQSVRSEDWIRTQTRTSRLISIIYF